MSTPRKFLLAFGAALFALGGVASTASATFHFTKIREVSSGTGAANTSYIETQAYFDFQNFLSNGAELHTCAQTCATTSSFSGFTDVANGHNQDTVLFADSGISAGSKDFNVDLNLEAIQAGGAACYTGEIGYSDCVSWGNFNDNAGLMTLFGTTAGNPAPALTSGMALRRSIAAGCPTALEPGDDTNNSATDFSLTTQDPRPNSVTPTETPCAGGGPTGYPTPPSTPSAKKKKCKKHKGRAAMAKKCKKRK